MSYEPLFKAPTPEEFGRAVQSLSTSMQNPAFAWALVGSVGTSFDEAIIELCKVQDSFFGMATAFEAPVTPGWNEIPRSADAILFEEDTPFEMTSAHPRTTGAAGRVCEGIWPAKVPFPYAASARARTRFLFTERTPKFLVFEVEWRTKLMHNLTELAVFENDWLSTREKPLEKTDS